MLAATSFCGVWPQLFSGLVSGPAERVAHVFQCRIVCVKREEWYTPWLASLLSDSATGSMGVGR